MNAGVEKSEYVIETVKQSMKHRHWSVDISRQTLQTHTHYAVWLAKLTQPPTLLHSIVKPEVIGDPKRLPRTALPPGKYDRSNKCCLGLTLPDKKFHLKTS